MFIYYFIISGLIVGIWSSYREYETNWNMSVLDVLLNIVGFMLIGWIMLPIIIIASLDNIKIK
jgi:biotin transporter BioY